MFQLRSRINGRDLNRWGMGVEGWEILQNELSGVVGKNREEGEGEYIFV